MDTLSTPYNRAGAAGWPNCDNGSPELQPAVTNRLTYFSELPCLSRFGFQLESGERLVDYVPCPISPGSVNIIYVSRRGLKR
jgi:hypothetical protein